MNIEKIKNTRAALSVLQSTVADMANDIDIDALRSALDSPTLTTMEAVRTAVDEAEQKIDRHAELLTAAELMAHALDALERAAQ